MFAKFLSYINQKNLLKKESSILLAVSGGIDSMVMVDLFRQAEWPIGVAHINHHLRGAESDGDAAFLSGFCDQNGIPYFQLDLEPDSLKQGNMHANARAKRYEWLKTTAENNVYDFIATAHHQDDVTETFIINFMRGSGLDGLDGIPFQNKNVIRPLLFANRSEIENYAQTNQILYREDSSNQKDDYLRNHIRHRVVPVIHDADTRAKDGIKTSIEHLQSSAILLEYFVNQFIKDKTTFKEGHHIVPLDQISDTGVAMSLLFQIVKYYGFNIEQCHDMMSVTAKTGNFFYSQTHEALINRNTLIIRPVLQAISKISEQIQSLPWSIKLDTFEITMEQVPVPEIFDKSSETLYLQEDGLSFPLTIRHWQEGDVFKPLGLKGQKQKVKDFLINRKVNIFDKEKILVLISDDHIVAILMEGISEMVKVTSASSSCIKIQKRG